MKDEDDSKIIWLKLKPDFYWAATMTGVSFGNPEFKDPEDL